MTVALTPVWQWKFSYALQKHKFSHYVLSITYMNCQMLQLHNIMEERYFE